jgi:hypothetical protein
LFDLIRNAAWASVPHRLEAGAGVRFVVKVEKDRMSRSQAGAASASVVGTPPRRFLRTLTCAAETCASNIKSKPVEAAAPRAAAISLER